MTGRGERCLDSRCLLPSPALWASGTNNLRLMLGEVPRRSGRTSFARCSLWGVPPRGVMGTVKYPLDSKGIAGASLRPERSDNGLEAGLGIATHTFFRKSVKTKGLREAECAGVSKQKACKCTFLRMSANGGGGTERRGVEPKLMGNITIPVTWLSSAFWGKVASGENRTGGAVFRQHEFQNGTEERCIGRTSGHRRRRV
jgi:hypothetical protein